MIPNAEQVRAAIRNGQRLPRTAGARIQQALEHAKHSKKKASPEGLAQSVFERAKRGATTPADKRTANVYAKNNTAPSK